MSVCYICTMYILGVSHVRTYLSSTRERVTCTRRNFTHADYRRSCRVLAVVICDLRPSPSITSSRGKSVCRGTIVTEQIFNKQRRHESLSGISFSLLVFTSPKRHKLVCVCVCVCETQILKYINISNISIFLDIFFPSSNHSRVSRNVYASKH